jgi:pSer/pThr/pTyr-binding forkhead associated (FHA) protein
VIGRSAGSDISLRNDDYASGEHARILRQAGVLYVEDMNSTNGTFVNGRKCTGASALQPGDLLKIGSTTFRYKE